MKFFFNLFHCAHVLSVIQLLQVGPESIWHKRLRLPSYFSKTRCNKLGLQNVLV